MTEALRVAAGYDNRQLDPNDPDLFRAYSRQLLNLVRTDGAEIQRLRTSLDYPEVARTFKMIDDDTESLVITTYGTDDERQMVMSLLDGLRHPGQASVPPRMALRRLQPFAVAVRRREAQKYRQRGLVTDVHPAHRPYVSYGIAEWHGRYDAVCGLVAEGQSADAFVV